MTSSYKFSSFVVSIYALEMRPSGCKLLGRLLPILFRLCVGLDRYDGELHCFGLRVMNHLIFPHILEMSGRRGPKEGVSPTTVPQYN